MNLQRAFPRLGGNFVETSPRTPQYNCIAWAAGDDSQWWQPSGLGGHYWPPGVPLEMTLSAYRSAYETLGYEVTPSDDMEQGYEKVAIFVDVDGIPTHAARQLLDGRWTSKLGENIDIAHDTVSDVGGGFYGETALFMRRRIS